MKKLNSISKALVVLIGVSTSVMANPEDNFDHVAPSEKGPYKAISKFHSGKVTNSVMLEEASKTCRPETRGSWLRDILGGIGVAMNSTGAEGVTAGFQSFINRHINTALAEGVHTCLTDYNSIDQMELRLPISLKIMSENMSLEQIEEVEDVLGGQTDGLSGEQTDDLFKRLRDDVFGGQVDNLTSILASDPKKTALLLREAIIVDAEKGDSFRTEYLFGKISQELREIEGAEENSIVLRQERPAIEEMFSSELPYMGMAVAGKSQELLNFYFQKGATGMIDSDPHRAQSLFEMAAMMNWDAGLRAMVEQWNITSGIVPFDMTKSYIFSLKYGGATQSAVAQFVPLHTRVYQTGRYYTPSTRRVAQTVVYGSLGSLYAYAGYLAYIEEDTCPAQSEYERFMSLINM